MKKHSEALIVNSDDWQGLFVDGKLIDEGHTLGEGLGILVYLQEKADEFNFNLKEIKQAWVTEEYEEYLYDMGSFHKDLKDVQYEIE
jgi:hypothetical protein